MQANNRAKLHLEMNENVLWAPLNIREKKNNFCDRQISDIIGLSGKQMCTELIYQINNLLSH